MLDRFRQVIQPPIFDDEDKTLRARMLNGLILMVFTIAPILFIGNLLEEQPLLSVGVSSVIVFLLAIWMRNLLFNGRVFQASVMWIVLSSAILTINGISLGTVRVSNTLALLINIVVVGFLLDKRAIIIVTIYNSLLVLVLLITQNLGWITPAPVLPGLLISSWLNYTAMFVGTAIFFSVAVQVLNDAVQSGKSEQSLLQQRDAILETASYAAQRFLEASNWRNEIQGVLEHLGYATGSSHVFIFEHHLLDDERLGTSLRYEWSAPGVKPDLDNPIYQNMVVNESNEKKWIDLMSSGEAYWANLDTLPEKDAELYRQQGLKALLNVPIFAGDTWWGVMGFDDMVTMRRWSSVEVDAIQIAARTLGATIQRQINDDALRQRDIILNAANFSAQKFLQVTDWRDAIMDVLERLGDVVHASHAYVFEQHTTHDGKYVLSLRYEWARDGIESDIDSPEFQNIGPDEIYSSIWYTNLSRGLTQSGNWRTLPSDEVAFIETLGIKSILETPIMIGDRWWGVIGFDDCEDIREWSPSEIEMANIAASTLGSAIQRQYGEEELRRRDAIMRAANFAAYSFLQAADWRETIQPILERLGEATQTSHVYIFERHPMPDGTFALSQRFEWVREGAVSEMDNPDMQNISLANFQSLPWYLGLSQGQTQYGNLLTLPEDLSDYFGKLGIKSILETPIMVVGEWWGVIGFDDCEVYREWSLSEVETIRIAASTLAATIHHHVSDDAFREAERRHREELEQRVNERTQQLQEALQEIEGVSFTASHDLRTPLRAVNGYASILLQDHSDKMDDEQLDYLRKIKKASQRMASLLDDLIHLIRYSRQPLSRQNVDLSQLATDAVIGLRENYPAHDITVSIQPELMAFGDKELLDVVINELMDNAWKFTTERKDAELEFGQIEIDGQNTFFLRDNGIGFDMVYVDKLFRNFEQLHQPGLYEGTGMGLATVHRIIQRHGGNIWVEGQPHAGATFYFTLPME